MSKLLFKLFIFFIFLSFISHSSTSAQSACSGIAIDSSGAPTASIAATDTGFLIRVTASGDEAFTRARQWELKDNNQTIFTAAASTQQGTGIAFVFNSNQVTFIIPNNTNPSSLATGAHTFTVLSNGTPSDFCTIGPIGIANPNRTSIDACWAIVGNVNLPGDVVKCEDLCTTTSGPNPGTYQTEAICNTALAQIPRITARCDVIPLKPSKGNTVSIRADQLQRNQTYSIEFITNGISSRIPVTNPRSETSFTIKLADNIGTGNYEAKVLNSTNSEVCRTSFKVEGIKGISGGGISCGTPTEPGISTAIGCIHTEPKAFVTDILKFAVGIGGGLAFLMMLLGTFQMITSAGNPDTLHAGRDRFTSAIIGLLFIIFSVLLLQIIGFDILRLPGFDK